ncbi:MobC family plasmid mobilization relaxosome protein [Ruegeria sp. Alg231-54]|uniref:MobC family plasmid mobilization relaxosome protein n=1 Tax=Ruegeria sp. Alg231-54 TaxID=1922221 RepID=UPI000D5510E5|nr:MobC family plasmid mobilization relaxosome protein [Ruegeria sp. Alg231-54]
MPSGISKSVVKSMRFDEDEWAFLEQRRKVLQLRSVTGLVRMCLRVAFGIPTKEEFVAKAFNAHLVQLVGMANNLNQMTRAANAGKFRLNKRTEDQIAAMKVEIRELRRLFEDYSDTAHERSFTRALEIERLAEKQRAARVSPKAKIKT